MNGAGRVPRVARSRAALSGARRHYESPVAVVMTLGALHEGHAALLRAAREQAASVIVTIFVNPLQFGPGEDFERYPRTLDADLAVCAEAGTDLVFAPPQEEVYPHGQPRVLVDPGVLGSMLEGASRPGHFAGVLTVVLKLLHLTNPDLAFFGEKDYQQLTLIRTMVRDLDLPTRIVAVPTVREADGLARSSRNRYLTGEQRLAARAVPAALQAGAAAAATPAATPEKVLAAAAAAACGVDLDYLALTDDELRPLATPLGGASWPAGYWDSGATGEGAPAGAAARLLIAARVGTTRLIDNAPLDLPRDPDRQTPR